MIKAVIFDLDDTIIETNKHFSSGLKYTYRRHKNDLNGATEKTFLEANAVALKECIKLKERDFIRLHQLGILVWYLTLEKLDLTRSPHLVDQLYQSLQTYILEHIRIQPGFEELLKYLKDHQYQVAILSNGYYAERVNKLKAVKLLDKVDLLVTSDVVGKDKPHPKPFKFTLDKLRVKASEALLVGDSVKEDVEGGLGAGIRSVLYAPQIGKEPQKYQTVSDFNEIIRIFRTNEV